MWTIRVENYINFYAVNSAKKVELTAKEYAILQILKEEPNKVLTRTEFVNRVAFNCNKDRSLDVNIHRIKNKCPGINIETIHEIGYRWNGDIK